MKVLKSIVITFIFILCFTGCGKSVKENSDVKRTTEKKEEEQVVSNSESEELLGEKKSETDESTEVIVSGKTEEKTTELAMAEDYDYYSICSTYSKSDIENYANTIRRSILNKDWNTLAGEVSYPIQIGSVECNNKDDFNNVMWDEILSADFYTELENESCEDMFCNYMGIMLGNGHVWISEVIDENNNSKLRVISINP